MTPARVIVCLVIGYLFGCFQTGYLYALKNHYDVAVQMDADGQHDALYLKDMEELAEGTYFLALRGKRDDPEFAEALVKLRLSGFETDGLALYGYEAIKLWAALVEKAGSFDYTKLSKAAKNEKIETGVGHFMFHNGTPQKNESYAVYQYQNGALVKVD